MGKGWAGVVWAAVASGGRGDGQVVGMGMTVGGKGVARDDKRIFCTFKPGLLSRGLPVCPLIG